MATFNITETYGKTIKWYATLSSSFNTKNYILVGISTSSFMDGTTTKPSGSIVEHKATSSTRTSKNTPSYSDNLSITSGSKTLYAYTQSASGQYWLIESTKRAFTGASITISSVGSTSAKFRISYESAMKYKRFVYKEGTSGTAKYLPSSSTWHSSSSAYSTTISGLKPNTTYYYNGIVSSSSTQSNDYSVNIYASNTKSFTTSALEPSVSLSTTVLSHNAIRATFTYDSNYPYYRLRWKKSSSSTWTYNSSSYTSYSATVNYSIGSLSSNTSYDIEVLVATSSSGTSSSSGDTDSATTLPVQSANISITSIGLNSVSGTITIDSNYRYLQAIYRKASTTTPSYYPTSLTRRTGTTWSFTISGLDEDTDYVLNGRGSATGETAYAYNILDTALPFHTLAPTPEVSYVSHTEHSITGKVTGFSSSYAYQRTVYLSAYLNGTMVKESQVTISAGATTSGNITVTGLKPNTTYEMQASVYLYGSQTTTYIGSFTQKTDALAGTISYVSGTETSLTLKVSGLSTNSGVSRIISLDATMNGSTISNGSVTITATASSTGNIVISGLSKAKTYIIKGYVSFDGGSTYHYFGSDKDISAKTEGVAITLWDWDTANATANPNPATKAQTQAARNACRDKTAVSNFSWKVWNDLVYKVSEARVAGGNDSWNNYYATRDNTLMTSSSKTLTATRYNSLRYNIGIAYSVPDSKKIPEVSKGDAVGGTTHFLNFVTNYLNAYINTLL